MRVDALGLRPELLVKHDVLEFRQPVFEPRLQIGLVEELRIRQPRADDALVAGDDCLAAVVGFEIGDEQKLVDELGVRGVAQHEAFLVVADGGADHFFGDLQELSSNEPISTTGHSTRPATSLSRPSSSTSSSPCAKASCFASVRMMSRRRSASSTTLALSSLCK